MCDPVSITMAVIGTATAMEAHSAQNKAYKANAKAAAQAKIDEDRVINLQEAQEQEAAATQKIEQNRQTQELASSAAVAGGESGGFLNNNAVVQDIMRQGLEANTMTGQNLERTKAQLGEQRLGAKSKAQSRINSVSKASGVATALKIGSAGVDAWAGYKAAKKPPTTPTPPEGKDKGNSNGKE